MASEPVIIHVDQPIAEAAVRMREADVGLLFVVDGDELVGVVTDRDLAIRGVANGRDPSATPVIDVMTRHVVFCHRADSREDALGLMSRQKIRRLAVIDDDRELVGVVSLGDMACRREPPRCFARFPRARTPQRHPRERIRPAAVGEDHRRASCTFMHDGRRFAEHGPSIRSGDYALRRGSMRRWSDSPSATLTEAIKFVRPSQLGELDSRVRTGVSPQEGHKVKACGRGFLPTPSPALGGNGSPSWRRPSF